MATALRSAITDARTSAIPLATQRPTGASILTLGRIEARRMILHPAFPISMAFSLLLLRGLIGAGAETDLFANLGWLIAGLMLGVLVGTVVSANIAALRPRRDRVRELYGSLPAPPEARTAGLLTGLLMGPVALSVVLTALGWIVLRRDEDLGPHIDLFLAVQVPLTVVALGAIGIAVARWVPSLLGGPIVIAAHMFTGIIWAVPWVIPSSEVSRPWHLIYLAAALTTWIALAFARDRRTPVRFVVAASAFAIGVVAAFQQVPPGGW